jgi:hypothetical protein
MIKDVGSNLGTFINSNRLSEQNKKSDPKELFSGDIIEFGQDGEDKKGMFKKIGCKVLITFIDRTIEVGNNAKPINIIVEEEPANPKSNGNQAAAPLNGKNLGVPDNANMKKRMSISETLNENENKDQRRKSFIPPSKSKQEAEDLEAKLKAVEARKQQEKLQQKVKKVETIQEQDSLKPQMQALAKAPSNQNIKVEQKLVEVAIKEEPKLQRQESKEILKLEKQESKGMLKLQRQSSKEMLKTEVKNEVTIIHVNI